MNRFPITYEPCGDAQYSTRGLAKLSPSLKELAPLPYSAFEQRQEAATRAGKISIQGVQPKLSARLNIKEGRFDVVDAGGAYILKPQQELFTQMPENEDVTMKMAVIMDIEVPLTGLLYSKDNSFSYFIKRFDRHGKQGKFHLEDFAQLTYASRDTKYDSTMERIIPVLDYCTFPVVEKLKFFRRVLFCFLIGNEDMHLKNFSLITRKNLVTLSPAYDLLNSSISQPKYYEELALPLAGKKSNIKRNDLVDYYAKERLGIQQKAIETELQRFAERKRDLRHLFRFPFCPMR